MSRIVVRQNAFIYYDIEHDDITVPNRWSMQNHLDNLTYNLMLNPPEYKLLIFKFFMDRTGYVYDTSMEYVYRDIVNENDEQKRNNLIKNL